MFDKLNVPHVKSEKEYTSFVYKDRRFFFFRLRLKLLNWCNF